MSNAQEVRALRTRIAKLLELLRDWKEAEWMVTHNWGGDRDSLYERTDKELESIAKAEGERKPAKELTLAEARARLAQREAEIRASMDKPPEPKPTPDIDRS